MTLFFCIVFTIFFLLVIILPDICYRDKDTEKLENIISYYLLVIPMFCICILLWCLFTTETELCISKHCSDYESGKIVKIYTFDSNNNKIDSTYIYK